MKNLSCMLIACCFAATTYGQSPDWQVAENEFEHTMSLVAFLNVEGVTLTGENDRVAAFVNGVCRGVSKLTEVKSHQEDFAYLTIFGNSNNELVTFKIYESSTNRIIDVEKTLVFRINGHRGNLLQPYSIAQPALRATAAIEEFSLRDVIPISEILEDGSIIIKVENTTNLLGHTVEFEVGDGAQLFLNNQLLVSGDNQLDFLQPVTFHVRSEDRSVLKPWTVSMEPLGDILVYRRKASCFEPGAIKVTGNREGQSFSLIRQGQVLNSRPMVSGEVLFENLIPGAYLVRAEGFEKQVNID